MTTSDEWLEAQLRRGHPEADGYSPPPFAAVLSRSEMGGRRFGRAWLGSLAAAAVVAAIVIGIAYVSAPPRVEGPGGFASPRPAFSPPSAVSITPATATPTSAAADPIAEVQAALLTSGITVVDAQETTSGTTYLSCGRDLPMRTFTFNEEPPHATFRPGEKPPIEALLFASPIERRAYESQISSDGTQLRGAHCSAIIDWVAPPHWIGGGRYLLLVVTTDETLAAKVAAAAARLGPP